MDLPRTPTTPEPALSPILDAEPPGSAATGDPADAPPAGARRRSRALRWLLIAVAAAAAIAIGWRLVSSPRAPVESERSAARVVPVSVASVETAGLTLSIPALGTVTPLATVTVRPRIAGHLTQLGFVEGQRVRAGQFLAQIDPRPYQAALDQAKGQFARDQALLRNAEIDLTRYRALVEEDSIARQQLDTQESLVRQNRAALEIDRALVETAKLNLDYTKITSPIDGRVGLRQIDVGNYVQTSDAAGIVVITQMQPMTVAFSIPQDDLPRVLERMNAGSAPAVEAYDRAGTTLLATGALATVDNQIDPATGTIRLKALFANDDERLFPNQFVNVRLEVERVADALVVPAAAVQRGADGAYAWVVGPGDVVSARPVNAGATSGERLQILSGLALGERVVVDGVDRLREGARVSFAAGAGRPATDDRGRAQGGS